MPAMTTPLRDAQAWHALCPLAEVPPPGRGGRYVTLGRRSLTVLRVGEGEGLEIRVIDDTCPHAGASLSGGFIEDGCIICPHHAWAFDLATGRCPDNPTIAVRVYECEVRGGIVWARLPGVPGNPGESL